MTIFIGGDNVETFASIGGTSNYVNRDKVVILWDELDKNQKKLAERIDIDVEVQTENPSTVPDKWRDSVVEVGDNISNIDIVKHIIANPDREEVYELLKKEDPPEPLILWWLDKTFNDDEYMKLLAEVCFHGLFKSDTDYFWGVVAFGVEAGVGRFKWPESSSNSEKVDEIYEELFDEREVRLKEVEMAIDFLGSGAVRAMADEPFEEPDGVPADESDEATEGRSSSLLDFGG